MTSYVEAFARGIRPRKKLSVSEWADANRRLSSKSASEPGQWRTSRAPHTREIMDCLSSSHPAQRIVMMFAAQTGKTEIGMNWLGYIMDHAPSSVLVVVPTLEVRKKWVRQRLDDMLTVTPVLSKIFDAKRSRDSGNSEDIKDFPGGIIIIAGANSPASLSSMPIKYVLCDEVDRFPWETGNEGDPLGLIDERTKTFPRRKVFLASSPTIKGHSRIEAEYLQSDQRRYYLPCPYCQAYQFLKWSNLKWKLTGSEVTRAWYECEDCGEQIDEVFKTSMLGKGEWRAEYPERKTVGYALSGLYSPVGLGFNWLEISQKWLQVQTDPVELKRFINTTLGEPWEDQTSKFEAHDLIKRLEDVKQRAIPKGCLALTVGVDTQDKWLAVTLLGWGHGKLWIIEWHTIQGDTTRDDVWDNLEQYINTPLINSYGYSMRIDAAAIDTRGHRGEQVKNFVTRRSLRVPVFAVQGATTRMGKSISTTPSYPERTIKGKYVKGSYALWNVGTEHCKDFIYGSLASDEELPECDRTLHFPTGLDEDYFNGLLSETFDPEKNRYIQKTGAKYKRNEPIDTLVYAWAIGHHKEVRIGMTSRGDPHPPFWKRREDILEFTFMGGLDRFQNNTVVSHDPPPPIHTPSVTVVSKWGKI